MSLSVEQVESFRRYHELLLEGNEAFNLTRITGEREVVVKHFVDSLATLQGVPLPWRERAVTLLDVGSGAGFPGIPVLLACPRWHGILLEARRKKAEFLAHAIVQLGLAERVQARWGRAEEAPRDELGRYDVVTARAVADLGRLAGWTLPFVKPGGRAVLPKGPRADEEVEAAQIAMARSGGARPEAVGFELPEGHGSRSLVVIEKQHTEK